MEETIKIYQHTEGAIQERKSDVVIRRTYHFSVSILDRFVEDKANPKNSIMYMAYIKERDSFMVAHIQKNHVEFPGENRAYTTRSVFEVSKTEASDKEFKLGSIISLFPKMPKDGYERKEEEYVKEEYEWNLLDRKEFSDIEKVEIKNLCDYITNAFSERKNLYIKLSTNRKDYYAGKLQSATPFRQLLYAIDELPDDIRPYASFAFLANNALKDIHDDYLIVVYQEDGDFIPPENGLKIEWEELQQSRIEVPKHPPFVSDGNYSIAHLYKCLSSENEFKKKLLSPKHQADVSELPAYLDLLTSGDVKDLQFVKMQIVKILCADFKILKNNIESKTLDDSIIQQLASYINTDVVTMFIESEVDAKEVFEICASIVSKNNEQVWNLIKEHLKPEELDSISKYIVKYKDDFNSEWGWEVDDLKFTEYGEKGEVKLQELKNANHPLASLILRKIQLLKAEVLGLCSDDENFEMRHLTKFQDAIKNKDSKVSFFYCDELTRFVDVLLNSRKDLSDKQIAENYKIFLKYAKRRIKDKNKIEIVEEILSNCSIQSEIKQLASAHSKQLSLAVTVILLIGTSICSFLLGSKYGEQNAFSSLVATIDTIIQVDSEIVVTPQFDTLFAYNLPKSNVLSKKATWDTLIISKDISLFAASLDTTTHSLKRYMIDSVAVKDGKIENDSCPYKYKNVTNTDYYIWVLEQIERLKVENK